MKPLAALLTCRSRLRRAIRSAMTLGAILSAASAGAFAQKSRTVQESFDQIAGQAKQASETNELERAAQLYKKALGMRPGWTEGWWALGTLRYDQNKYQEAARAFRKIVVLDGKNGTAHGMLGLCQFELGLDDSALKNLEAAQRLGVLDNPQLRNVMLYHLGLLLLRKGRFGRAQDSLTPVAKAGVQSEDLFLALGMSALMMQPKNAPGKDTPGRTVVLRAGAAKVLASMKKFDEARAAFAALVGEFPDYPNLRYAYGRFLLEAHDTDAAVEQFKAELKENPRHVSSLLEIAAVNYRADSAEGLKYAERAAAIAPKLPFAHYLFGLLLLDVGRAEEAIAELQVMRQAFPDEPEVYFALGNAYARTGRKVEAAKARAIFRQLNAKKANQPGVNIYGEQPSGLTRGTLQTGEPPKPQE